MSTLRELIARRNEIEIARDAFDYDGTLYDEWCEIDVLIDVALADLERRAALGDAVLARDFVSLYIRSDGTYRGQRGITEIQAATPYEALGIDAPKVDK